MTNKPANVRDWVTEIIAVLVFATVFCALMYQYLFEELSRTGAVMMWLSFGLAILTLFGAERIKLWLQIMREQ